MRRSRHALIAAALAAALLSPPASAGFGKVRKWFDKTGKDAKRETDKGWKKTTHFSEKTVGQTGDALKKGYTDAVKGAKGAFDEMQRTLDKFFTRTLMEALEGYAKEMAGKNGAAISTLHVCGPNLFGAKRTQPVMGNLFVAVAEKKVESSSTTAKMNELKASPEYSACTSAPAIKGKFKSFSFGMAFSGNTFPVAGAESGIGFVVDLKANPTFKGWFALGGTLSTAGDPDFSAAEQTALWTVDAANFAGPYVAIEVGVPVSGKMVGVQVYFATPRTKKDWDAAFDAFKALPASGGANKLAELFPFIGIGLTVGASFSSSPPSASIGSAGGFTWTLPPYALKQ